MFYCFRFSGILSQPSVVKTNEKSPSKSSINFDFRQSRKLSWRTKSQFSMYEQFLFSRIITAKGLKLKLMVRYICRGTVAEWIEHSTCNAESTGLSLHSGGHCVKTLSKSFTHYCLAPSMLCRMVACALLNFEGVQYQVQLCCIVSGYIVSNTVALWRVYGIYGLRMQVQFLEPITLAPDFWSDAI